MRDKLVKDPREVEYYYSLATDLWLPTGKIEPYLAVTLHRQRKGIKILLFTFSFHASWATNWLASQQMAVM